MCKKIVCLLTCILLFSLCSAAVGTTYYVSPSGNDNNSGTSAQDAWATIDKVTTVTFSPGDSILFEGGETFSGQLAFDASDAGTPTSPVTVSSYGSGRATLSNPTMGVEGSESIGLKIYNAGGFEIRDLILVGPGNEGDWWDENVGIGLEAQLGSGERLDYIRIDNIEISNYAGYGIELMGNNYSGFRDVEITNCVLHHIGKEAICSKCAEWPMSASSHNDFYIADCTMYMITGVGTKGPHSGSGINLSAVDGGTIEFCEAYDSGSWCMAEGGGPLGIWCWEAENLVFQFNEVYNQKTSGGDGGGFDLDG
ncbi:MAG: right-handed parallel beta-helix repeat-containing protein, partial [Planctomycetota bacterium]